MKSKSKFNSLLKLGVLFAVVWLIVEWSWAGEFIERLKYGEEYAVFSWQEEDQILTHDEQSLRELVENKAAELYIAPIDARIDPVWKAIPGYNGKEVDIEATIRLAQKMDGPIPWVFREISPRVSLDDLGAHPVYKGNPKKNMVSLMFNVAWGEEHLDSILSTLQKKKVSATFFLDGKWLSKNVEMAKKIQEHGHEISNHGYSHQLMSGLSREKATKEIAQTEQLLKEHLQVENKLYAPAAGDFNQMTVNIAGEMNLKTVLWTLDTVDWKKPPPETIIQRIVPRLEPGAMILMHPTEPTSQALEQLIDGIKNKGYAIDTVSELLSPKRIDTVEHQLNFW